MRLFRLLPAVLILASGCSTARPYKRLAKELSAELKDTSRKVAVMPFKVIDRTPAVAGMKVAEGLTTQLQGRGVALVERNLLSSVFEEYQLGAAGATEADSAKDLGRLLGADAVIVGSVSRLDARRAEVNARAIDTASGRVLSAARALVPVTWTDAEPEPMLREAAQAKGAVKHASKTDFLAGDFSGWGIVVTDGGALKLGRKAARVAAVDSTTPMPRSMGEHGAAMWNGRIYVAGGNADHGSGYAEVYSAPINSDGLLGAWRQEISLPEGRYQAPLAAWGGRLYLAGGYHGAYRDDVFTASISDDGRIGTWSKTTSLPVDVIDGAMIAWGGQLFLAGGSNVDGNLAKVHFANILPDGGLGEWDSITLPESRAGAGVAVSGGLLAVLGGSAGGGKTASTVFVSALDEQGLLSGFKRARASLPKGRIMHAVSQWDGWVYVIGGMGGQQPYEFSNDVYSGLLRGEEPGPWATETLKMPEPIRNSGYAAPSWNGRAYVLGGHRRSLAYSGSAAVYVLRLEEGGIADSGTYFNSLDLGTEAPSAEVRWRADPNGGTLRVRGRWASGAMKSYSPWAELSNGEVLSQVRKLEYRVDMRPSADGRSPVLHEIGLSAR